MTKYKKLKIPYIFAVLSIVLGLLIFIASIILISTNNEIFGEINQFLVGLIGAFWALAGVLLFYNAIRVQQIEINTQTEELSLQREEFIKQTSIANFNLILQITTERLRQFEDYESNFRFIFNQKEYSGRDAHVVLRSEFWKNSQKGGFALINWEINDFDEKVWSSNPSDKLKEHISYVVNCLIENVVHFTSYMQKLSETIISIESVIKSSNLSENQENILKKLVVEFIGENRISTYYLITNMVSLWSATSNKKELKDVINECPLDYYNNINISRKKHHVHRYFNEYWNLDSSDKMFNWDTPHNNVHDVQLS